MKLIKKPKIENPDVRVDFFSRMFSSGLFIGYVPFASGTFGTAFALIFFLIPAFHNHVVLSVVFIASFIIGVFTSQNMIQKYGKDPSQVVIDEITGMWFCILVLLFLNVEINLYVIFVSFILFRIFDIVKIFPAGYFDKINNGYGIMMDDIVSAFYAALLTFAFVEFLNF
ncbi:MAG: phosphatidylglycerophosphatase A [Ignavibacteria bacterium]|nr:phosphatidylglycerophosphatase A [Ignavibacteria bacterium]